MEIEICFIRLGPVSRGLDEVPIAIDII